MSMLQQIKSFLGKPFPSEENQAQLLMSMTLISIFVTFFLYAFQPFGIANIESNKFFICLGFGAATFISSCLYEFLTIYLFKLKNGQSIFTFGKWIVHLTGLIFFISLANFLFVRWAVFGDIRWEFFPAMIRGTFMVGIFPTIFIGGLALLRQEKKYQKIADEINSQEQSPNVVSNETKSFEGVQIEKIRYIESLQNYVKIGHTEANGNLTEKTIRTSLKNVLAQLNGSTIIKCHRSYLVNQANIISTSGNAQGLLLTLENCDKLIPVSRSFVSKFKAN